MAYPGPGLFFPSISHIELRQISVHHSPTFVEQPLHVDHSSFTLLSPTRPLYSQPNRHGELVYFRTNVRRVIVKGGQKQKLTHTVPNVPEMRMPAVSQPTQTTLESTESVATEQVSTQAVMSEPTVSQPTQTVLEYTQTVSTEQVPTETAMKRMSPAMQEFAEVVAWLKSDLAIHTSAVLLFRAASSHLTSPI
ncbi:hypothetical protein CBS147332_6303 [Penicillium roqueforti]|nr:hypothetical protein CBS147332_6303 [Penicillium roqueforti]KAI3098694.1 hypothetical protein CBS147331_8768 [Penicillium roqueforti]